MSPGELFLNRFKIIALKGRGAFGEVYQALDTKLQRVVAIKLIPSSFLNSDTHNRRRFQNEIVASAAIGHPHLVILHDADYTPAGDGFIIMEFMAGGNVRDQIHDNGAMNWQDVVQQGIGLCEALHALHERGFIHRDIKPDNIMFTGGDRKCAKIGDLGIVHVGEMDEQSSLLTQPGTQPGTLLWMAPEQLMGGSSSVQSDVYALGATFFFMLTGSLHIRVPARAHPLVMAKAVAENRLIQVRSIMPAIPDTLATVVEKSLQRETSRRFASAEDFGRALKDIVEQRVGVPEVQSSVILPSSEVVQHAAQKVIAISKRPPVLSGERFNIRTAKPGTVWIWPKDGTEIVFVPAGPFRMGSNQGLRGEMPEHEAVIGAYLIDKYPVTNARYKKFLDEVQNYPVPRGGAPWSAHFDWDPVSQTFPPGQDDYPVIMVTFDDARAFAAWAGKRLPTEAEWEKAARWDPATGRCNVYPWGDEWDTDRANSTERVAGCSFPPITGGTDLAYVWFQQFRKLDALDPQEANSYELMTKVYAYPQGASSLGVMDMAGNVHEWCESEYQARCYDGQSDPAIKPDEASSIQRCKGGAWADHPFYLRASSRYAQRGTGRVDRIGFRCAVSV